RPQSFHRRADTQSTGIASLAGAALSRSGQVVTDDVSRLVAESQDALLERVGRNSSCDLKYLREAPPFVVSEEEGLVAENRSAEACAKAVVLQFRFLDAVVVVVPGVRVQIVVLVIPVSRAMPAVGAMPTHQRHLSAGGAVI